MINAIEARKLSKTSVKTVELRATLLHEVSERIEKAAKEGKSSLHLQLHRVGGLNLLNNIFGIPLDEESIEEYVECLTSAGFSVYAQRNSPNGRVVTLRLLVSWGDD